MIKYSLSFSQTEIKKAAEMKEWFESRINDLESEIVKLKDTLMVLDSVLKRASFMPAAELEANVVDPNTMESTSQSNMTEAKEVRQLRVSNGGKLLANAYISTNAVAIVPASDVKLHISTTPFKSFFVGKILDGMKSKDLESIKLGKLTDDKILDYDVEQSDEQIVKIVIRNHRDANRLDEIINTATWTFSRMLEKVT